MNTRPSVITSTGRRFALWLATAALALATAFAHAGFKHVMGTIARVSGNIVTVTTPKGNVDLRLTDRTELTRNGHRAQLADLKPGARVVAEVPEESKDNVAQSVKIGAVPKTPVSHTHTSRR